MALGLSPLPTGRPKYANQLLHTLYTQLLQKCFCASFSKIMQTSMFILSAHNRRWRRNSLLLIDRQRRDFWRIVLCVQPIMSLFRCAPDHEHRPLFNWAHFLVGTSAYIVGGQLRAIISIIVVSVTTTSVSNPPKGEGQGSKLSMRLRIVREHWAFRPASRLTERQTELDRGLLHYR